ncbi:MAG: hypothetical protein KA138_11345 [Saprospiraceae bacterium]|nr:hypothetical protein [Saprospiraceae bacterium]
MEHSMSARQIRIAELIENLEKLAQLIDLHKQTTRNASMIKQYEFKRKEFVDELQGLFKPLSLRLEMTEAA